MSLIQAFQSVSSSLIEVMGFILAIALTLRYVAYRSGMRDGAYFKAFCREIEKVLEHGNDETGDPEHEVADVEGWLKRLLDKVVSQLPERSARHAKFGTPAGGNSKGEFRNQGRESLKEFADGKKAIAHAVRQQVDAFKSPFPPNFVELTNRVLSQDKRWKTILGFIPIAVLNRMLEILPGLFIVGGIFGTFIGITSALPMIAQIDLSNLDKATPVLNEFVGSIAYSMNTSISGIIYSVILTLINALFPITSGRMEVHKGMQRCFEFVWYKLHGNKMRPAEVEMIHVLRDIRTGVETQSLEKSA